MTRLAAWVAVRTGIPTSDLLAAPPPVFAAVVEETRAMVEEQRRLAGVAPQQEPVEVVGSLKKRRP